MKGRTEEPVRPWRRRKRGLGGMSFVQSVTVERACTILNGPRIGAARRPSAGGTYRGNQPRSMNSSGIRYHLAVTATATLSP